MNVLFSLPQTVSKHLTSNTNKYCIMQRLVNIIEEGDGKCGICNFRGVLYRLADEDDEIAVCGTCFASWAAENLVVKRKSNL